MSSVTLLLLLCLSVHACNARSLGIINVKESAGNKGVNEAKLHKSQIHQLGQQLGNSALLTQVQKEIGNNIERKIYVNEEESKAFLKEEAAASKSATSGDTIVPSQNDFQRLAKTEVLQSSQARSLLVGDDTDEALDSKENDLVEDTVVMDYAQPHRKPPIHNERP